MKKAGRFASLETGRDGQAAAKTARDATYYMNKALANELAGRHEKALVDYADALVEEPLFITAWARQLWMLLYLDEAPEANTWADKALRYFPNDPDILALKSVAQWRNGKLEEARQLNDAAMAANRDCANVWLARGEIRLETEGFPALGCFRHAMTAPGMAGLTEIRAGDILLRTGWYKDAAGFFRRAVGIFPKSAWAWYGSGMALRSLDNEDGALRAFKRACKLAPEDRRYRQALDANRGFWGRVRRLVGL